jgi:hypothetical protein
MNVSKTDIIHVLLDNIKNCKGEEVLLPNFYNPTLRLTSETKPKVLEDDNFKKVNVSLNFICARDVTTGFIDYTSSYYTLAKKDWRDPTPGLTFHTFSDMVSSTAARYDVLTFYITFILVIGNIMRNMLSSNETKIIFTDMPDTDSLIKLCEGIKISRYGFEFEREEYLYYVLIDYMRSPEILKVMTKSSIKMLKERKEQQIKMSMLN